MNPLEQIIAILRQYDELSTGKQLLDTFAKYSNNIEQYDMLGKLYNDLKCYNDAYIYTKKALTIAPDNNTMYSCRANLSKLCNHMNNPEESLYYLNINNLLTPNNPEVLLEMVFSFFLLNKKEESEKILRELKEDILSNNIEYSEPVLNRINFNLGTYDLYKGKFQQGLEGFLLSGKKAGIWKNIDLQLPFWDGEILPNHTILIMAEGGIGDEIINVRFMKYIQDLGMEPIWVTSRKDLAEVFNRNGYRTITDISNINPDNVVWTYSMTLPLYLKLNEQQLWNGSYLLPISSEVLPKSDKPKLGMKWFGNPLYEQDLHRSIKFDELYDTVNTGKYEIYSLQRDEGKEESYNTNVKEIPEFLEKWEDTLSVINELDIVVTSCTSIAHASAAMGKRTFVLVPITAYYVWASTTDESTIWYGDNVTVLRQTTHKCWKEPLEKLAQYLR